MIEARVIFCKAVREDGRMKQTTNARAIAALACEVSLAADAPANDLALANEIGKYKYLDSAVDPLGVGRFIFQ
jgi:hypothetical protein